MRERKLRDVEKLVQVYIASEVSDMLILSVPIPEHDT